MRAVTTTIAALVITVPFALAQAADRQRPRLQLRASPRVAFSPVVVSLTAELRGGDEVEDFYCPELEWDWGDGSRSARAQDCPPYEAGMELDRRYTEQHVFRTAGTYDVSITMRRGDRVLSVARAVVSVRPGLGDFSED